MILQFSQDCNARAGAEHKHHWKLQYGWQKNYFYGNPSQTARRAVYLIHSMAAIHLTPNRGQENKWLPSLLGIWEVIQFWIRRPPPLKHLCTSTTACYKAFYLRAIPGIVAPFWCPMQYFNQLSRRFTKSSRAERSPTLLHPKSYEKIAVWHEICTECRSIGNVWYKETQVSATKMLVHESIWMISTLFYIQQNTMPAASRLHPRGFPARDVKDVTSWQTFPAPNNEQYNGKEKRPSWCNTSC